MLINLIDYGMNLQEAGDAARIRHEGGREPTGVYTAMPAGCCLSNPACHPRAWPGSSAAAEFGLTIGPGGFGGYQAIMRDPTTGVYTAATEMRKDGLALGYWTFHQNAGRRDARCRLPRCPVDIDTLTRLRF